MFEYNTPPAEQPRQQPLHEIPRFHQPSKIIILEYSHNSITKISPFITKAVNVQTIDLSHNKIKQIQPLYSLFSLRLLNLAHNQICTVGFGIAQLIRLEVLDLSYNLIDRMDRAKGLTQLWKVRKANIQIDLTGNPVMTKEYQSLLPILKTRRPELPVCEDLNKTLNLSAMIPSGEIVEGDKKSKKQQLSLLVQIRSIFQSSNTNIHQGQNVGHTSSEELSANLASSIVKLDNFSNKFQVLLKSCKWNPRLLQLLAKQSDPIEQFIELHKSISKFDGNQQVDLLYLNECKQRGNKLKDEVKQRHDELLRLLNQYPSAPLKSYQIWVKLFRDLRILSTNIFQQAKISISLRDRANQLSQLQTLSPEKDIKLKGNGKNLESLLFSNNKQSSSSKSNKAGCDECYIKAEELKQLKDNLGKCENERSTLKIQVDQLRRQNEILLKKWRCVGGQTKASQSNIISQLSNPLNSSVYQSVLLEQAKGIQSLLKIQCPDFAYQHPNNQESSASSQVEKKKITYFTHQSSISRKEESDNKTKSRHTESSSKPKKDPIKASISNERQSNSTTTNDRTVSAIGRQPRAKGNIPELISSKPKRQARITEENQYQKDVIIVSDFVVTDNPCEQIDNKTISLNDKMTGKYMRDSTGSDAMKEKGNLPTTEKYNNKNQAISQDEYDERSQSNLLESMTDGMAELLRKDSNKQKYHSVNLLRVEDANQIGRQQRSAYVPFQFKQAELKDADQYSNYINYHLRNSIKATLSKKDRSPALIHSARRLEQHRYLQKPATTHINKSSIKNSSRPTSTSREQRKQSNFIRS